MSWTIVSNSTHQLGYSISEVGAPTCYGDGSHECRIDAHPLLARIKAAHISWNIAVPTQSESALEAGCTGLHKRAKEDPLKQHGALRFFSNSYLGGDHIGCSIVVPTVTLSRVQHIVEVLWGRPDLEFLIDLGFSAFRLIDTETTGVPSWQEFIDGRPAFLDSVSFILKNSPRGGGRMG